MGETYSAMKQAMKEEKKKEEAKAPRRKRQIGDMKDEEEQQNIKRQKNKDAKKNEPPQRPALLVPVRPSNNLTKTVAMTFPVNRMVMMPFVCSVEGCRQPPIGDVSIFDCRGCTQGIFTCEKHIPIGFLKIRLYMFAEHIVHLTPEQLELLGIASDLGLWVRRTSGAVEEFQFAYPSVAHVAYDKALVAQFVEEKKDWAILMRRGDDSKTVLISDLIERNPESKKVLEAIRKEAETWQTLNGRWLQKLDLLRTIWPKNYAHYDLDFSMRFKELSQRAESMAESEKRFKELSRRAESMALS